MFQTVELVPKDLFQDLLWWVGALITMTVISGVCLGD